MHTFKEEFLICIFKDVIKRLQKENNIYIWRQSKFTKIFEQILDRPNGNCTKQNDTCTPLNKRKCNVSTITTMDMSIIIGFM